jgi:hypothetical protein
MAGKGRPENQPADHNTPGRRGVPSGTVGLDTARRSGRSIESRCFGSVEVRYTVGHCRSSNRAHRARSGNDRSIKACGPRSRCTLAGNSGSGWELLSIWVDRQWSNQLEGHVAQARCVVMGYGLAGAHRKELNDKRLLS